MTSTTLQVHNPTHPIWQSQGYLRPFPAVEVQAHLKSGLKDQRTYAVQGAEIGRKINA